MKKVLIIFVLCLTLCFASCVEDDPSIIIDDNDEIERFIIPKYLERPKDTNLEFWITENVTVDSFASCTYVPGWFGAREYLGTSYVLSTTTDEYDNIYYNKPEQYVSYVMSNYPDCSSETQAVIYIDITDPTINVYGLTINSTEQEITETMIANGFIKSDNNSWYKNNCTFRFTSTMIRISAKKTNIEGIIY